MTRALLCLVLAGGGLFAQSLVAIPHAGLRLLPPAGFSQKSPPAAGFSPRERALTRLEYTAEKAGFYVRFDGEAQKLDDLLDQSVADPRARGITVQVLDWKVSGATRTRRLMIPDGEIHNHLALLVRGEQVLFFGAWHASGDQAAKAAIEAALNSVALTEIGLRFADEALDLSFVLPGPGLVEQSADKSLRIQAFPPDKFRLALSAPIAQATEAATARPRLETALKDFAEDRPLKVGSFLQIPNEGAAVPRLLAAVGAAEDALSVSAELRRGRCVLVEAYSDAQLKRAWQLLDSLGPAEAEDPLAGGRPARFNERRGPPIRFTLPAGWEIESPSSAMRLANVKIPGTPPTVVAVFWFGPGAGGDIPSNIDRWKGQFREGAKAKIEEVTIEEGVSVTFVDISGHFIAERNPGAGDNVDEPDTRMLGAILDVPQGPLFLKATGPIADVNRAAKTWRAWVMSFRKLP